MARGRLGFGVSWRCGAPPPCDLPSAGDPPPVIERLPFGARKPRPPLRSATSTGGVSSRRSSRATRCGGDLGRVWGALVRGRTSLGRACACTCACAAQTHSTLPPKGPPAAKGQGRLPGLQGAVQPLCGPRRGGQSGPVQSSPPAGIAVGRLGWFLRGQARGGGVGKLGLEQSQSRNQNRNQNQTPTHTATPQTPNPVQTSPAIALDRDKCIKCGRCVETCQDVQKMNVLGWFARGRERHIGFMLGGLGWGVGRAGRVWGARQGLQGASQQRGVRIGGSSQNVSAGKAGRGVPLASPTARRTTRPTPRGLKRSLPPRPRPADSDASVSACISCGQCVSVCPVGALSESTHWRSVLELLESKHKVGGIVAAGAGAAGAAAGVVCYCRALLVSAAAASAASCCRCCRSGQGAWFGLVGWLAGWLAGWLFDQFISARAWFCH